MWNLGTLPPKAQRPCFLVVLGLWLTFPVVAVPVPDMRLHFIDVGQGDATLIEFPCAAGLVDTGGERSPGSDSREALAIYLDRFFARRADLNGTLELLAITHPHRDHSEGIRTVLSKYRVKNVVTNGHPKGDQRYLIKQARQGGIPHRAIEFARLAEVKALAGPIIDPVDCRQGQEPIDIDPKIEVLWGQIGEDPGWGYATGWGGSVIIAGRASDGWLKVEQPLGQTCGSAPPPVGDFAGAESAPMASAVTADPALGADELRVLAPRPMCEASAALAAPWEDELILVADNEIDEQLYGFEPDDGRLAPKKTWAMPKGKRPRDIEALAQVGDSVLVVGSHSRNSRCEEKTKRQRLRLLASRSDGSLKEQQPAIDDEATWAKAREGQAECLATLFTVPPPPLAAATCRALLEAEKIAENGVSCPVLNIEGAFGSDEQRVWLGFRAPLVEGRAVVVRLTSELNELRFDQVALLDLETRGIRELAFHKDTVYGIAGPSEDANDPFALFSITLDGLAGGGLLRPEMLHRDLVTSSEGMAIQDGAAWITVDGDEGEPSCRKKSHQYRIELPNG